MIANLLIRILIFFVAYCAGRSSYVMRNRLIIMPILLAFNILWKQWIPFVGAGMFLFLANSVHIASAGFLFSLFNRHVFKVNKVLKPFIVLWVYLSLSALLGEKPIESMIYYADVALEWILPLTAYGYWMVNTPRAWYRTLCAMVPPLMFIALKYLRMSNITMAESYDMSDRLGIDASMLANERSLNVNAIGLIMSSLIPWCIFAVVVKMKTIWGGVLKLLSVIALVGLTAVLVRTGSRGGILVFLPLIYFIFHIKGRLSLPYKIIIFSLLSVAIVYAVFKTSGYLHVSDMRVFNFSMTSQDVSSGRFSHYARLLNEKHPNILNSLFGGGALYDHHNVNIPVIGNGHSSWVQLYILGGVLGLILFIVFILTFLLNSSRLGFRGQLALVMLLVWLVTGLAESTNLNQGGMGAKALMGIGLGMLCRGRTVLDEELVNGYDKRMGRMPR